MVEALCVMTMLMIGLVCLCLCFAALILGGGAVCRLYEWIRYDVLKKGEHYGN